MVNEEDKKARYESVYKEELDKASSEKLWGSFKHAVAYGIINGIPTGFLPYRAQKWIKSKVAAFSPKVASIASAAYLGLLGYYLFNLPSMDFSQVSNGSFFSSYSVSIYNFVIPAAAFQAIGGYLMLDTLRAPLSYFRRPHGTLAVEGVGYFGRLIKMVASKDAGIKTTAESNAKKRVGIMEVLEAETNRRAGFSELNDMQTNLYIAQRNSEDKEAGALKVGVNKVRKKIGLEEIL